jgi:hypothetical protein
VAWRFAASLQIACPCITVSSVHHTSLLSLGAHAQPSTGAGMTPNLSIERKFRHASRASSLRSFLTLKVMGIRLRRHNARAMNPNWWRRYFWSEHEFWAMRAAHKASIKAKHTARTNSALRPTFWKAVSRRALKYCYAGPSQWVSGSPLRQLPHGCAVFNHQFCDDCPHMSSNTSFHATALGRP